MNHSQFLRLADELEVLETKKRRKDLRDSIKKLMLRQQQSDLSKQMVDNANDKPIENAIDQILKQDMNEPVSPSLLGL